VDAEEVATGSHGSRTDVMPWCVPDLQLLKEIHGACTSLSSACAISFTAVQTLPTMSKRAFKSQASSARVASSAFGASSLTFGAPQAGLQTAASLLSYVAEQPDLSGVSNPQIVVALKNLSKRDSTTKAKALEELQEHLSTAAAYDGVETALLDAWGNLYPRTCIDNSRRVRQLAHTLQGYITVSSGKRILPYLPKIIGSWLAGTYDSDKGVARSAQDALEAAFSTVEKRDALWKVYRQALLDHVEDAVLVQSQQTLSDERTTSPDDSEAKHVRVMSTAAFVLLQLIKREPASVSAKTGSSSGYAKLLSNEKLWEYAYHKDASLRRAVYALIIPTLTNFEDHINLSIISTCFLAKALHISQLGSSVQYAEAILFLTEHHPQIWTKDYTAKTPASRRLFQFLRKGSQRGTESFWTNVGQLLRIVPVQVWTTTSSTDNSPISTQSILQDAESLLEALHEGVSNAEEPRQNASAAWSTYAATALWLTRNLKNEEAQILLDKQIHPIVENYISNEPKDTSWNIPAAHSSQICSRILVSLASSDHGGHFGIMWNNLSTNLVDSVKLSGPESSQDFRSSQDGVIAQAGRLFELHEQLARSILSENGARVILEEASTRIIHDCIKCLRDRNGKPYGAAGTIEAAVAVLSDSSTNQDLDGFLASDLSSLLGSPSGPMLVAILLRCPDYPSYNSCFEQSTETLLEHDSLPARDDLLTRLIQAAKPLNLTQSPKLVAYISSSLASALDGDPQGWKSVTALLGNKNLSSHSAMTGSSSKALEPASSQAILGTMMKSLSIGQRQTAALTGFEKVLSTNVSAKSILSAQVTSQLLPKLLIASDSPNEETATRATELSLRLQSLMKESGSSAISSSTFELLQQQFEGSGQFISVFGMVELTEQALKESDDASHAQLISKVLPSAEHWQVALKPFISRPPLPESAITSALQGVVYTIDHTGSKPSEDLPRDSDEFSVAMRLALYVTKLLSDGIFDVMSLKESDSMYLYYPMVLQLINENITIDSPSALWLNSTPEVIDEAVNLVSTGQKMIRKWIHDSATLPEGVVSIVDIWSRQISNMQGTSPEAYILGLCFGSIMSAHIDISGSAQALIRWKTEISSMHRSNDIVQSASLILALQDPLTASAAGKKLCNELIADVTELKGSGTRPTDLRSLILLNLLIHDDSDVLLSIPTQRAVFLFQNVVRILTSSDTTQTTQSEIYKLLCGVVPVVSDIYGEYWEQMLDAMVDLWEAESSVQNLPVLYSSLKLYSRLRSMLMKEPNEDLADAWTARKKGLDAALLHVLMLGSKLDVDANQPRDITTEALARQLLTVDIASLDSVEGLYPLLESYQQPVQTAAYELLHRAIPAKQEQTSLEIALEKTVVHLPAELLSLIADFVETKRTSKYLPMPDDNAARGHLLSWILVFDHFTNASFKLKQMYHADIKSSDHVPALLDTVCEILRITSGRPVDASKFDITNVNIESRGLTEKEAQSIAIDLYYKALLYVPDLVKEWFIEQKNRIKSPLESWTQKHISPLIVVASLEAATEWAATQDPDDRPVLIKPSPRASELVASITIDDESPPISLAISLPGAYPLEQAIVTSRNRVGVSDKNWQSWMRTIQIIVFSTGNLIEGLIAFRRNVQGALKGQTECAICYSIIGTDMKTPDKKCGTCKNTFHSVCLFRWFRSSNSSSCPLCRNNFNYA
jgi:hypothetical protein